MRHRHPPLPARALALAALGLLAAACQRGLEAPPAEVHIEAVLPDHGFAGDRVVICAEHLEVEAGDHQVWFAGQPAEVLDWAAADAVPAAAACSRGRLAVRVPLIDGSGPVAIKLAGLTSQHSLEVGALDGAGPFRYRGPGHPPADALGPPVRLRSRPISVSALGLGEGATRRHWMITANQGSKLLQLIDGETGLALGLGTCELPLSAELILRDWSSADDQLQVRFSAYAAVVDIEHGQSFALRPRLWQADIGLALDDAGQVEMTEFTRSELEPEDLPGYVDPTSGQERSLLPGRVWGRCHRDVAGGCDRRDLIVAHTDAPALAVLAGGDAGHPESTAMTLPRIEPACGHALGEVVELIDHPSLLAAPGQADDRLLVVLASEHPRGLGTEIWSFSADGNGDAPQRLFPPPDMSPPQREVLCSYRLQALAERRLGIAAPEDLRLFAADGSRGALLEMALVEPPDAPPRLEIQSQVDLPAPAFDLISARYATAHEEPPAAAERLYAATADGVFVFDAMPDAGLADEAVAVLALDDARGAAQSLTLLEGFEPGGPLAAPRGADWVVLVDAGRDGWTAFAAGAEEASRQFVPLTTSLAQVAPSGLLDGFFLADATSDVLRLVDRHTGVQRRQLRVGPAGGLSPGRLFSIHDPSREILVQALPESPADRPAGVDDERTRFDRLMLTGLHQQTDAALDGCDQASLEREVIALDAAFELPAGEDDAAFHQLQLLATEPPMLMLLRYGDGDAPGLYLSAALQPGPDEQGQLLPLDAIVMATSSAELPPQLERVRISPRSKLLGLRFSSDEATVLAVSDPAHPELDDAELLVETLEPHLAPFVSHFAAARSGDPGQPHYLLALPLSVLGEVLLLDFTVGAFDPPQVETRRAFLPTGGVPLYVYTSPDERRIYAVHPTEDLVSIIDLDCAPLPGCAQVVATLETPDAPYEVQFGRSGAVGYVTHLFNDVVSVIE